MYTRYEVFAQLLEQHPQTIDVENKKCYPGYYYHVSAIRLVLSTRNELILAPVVCSCAFKVAAIYANKRKTIAKRLCEVWLTTSARCPIYWIAQWAHDVVMT